MSTASMIYPDKKVAQMILGKMKKRHPTAQWELTQLPQGFKVALAVGPVELAQKMGVKLTFPPDSSPKAKTMAVEAVSALSEAPLPKKPTWDYEKPKPAKVAGLSLPQAKEYLDPVNYTMLVATTGGCVNLTFPFVKQSAGWVYVLFKGKEDWVSKVSAKAFCIQGDKVSVLLPTAYAKKRGFV